MQIQLKKASLEDKSELKQICIDGYTIYFGDHWNKNGLEWYLNKQFGDDKLNADLVDKYIDYYLIYKKFNLVGFMKINNNLILNPLFKEAAELEKMYILPKYKGLGIGKESLNEVIKITIERGKKILFLDVLDTNKSAFSFYQKLGFQFHSRIRLEVPNFREEFRGMNRMYLKLD